MQANTLQLRKTAVFRLVPSKNFSSMGRNSYSSGERTAQEGMNSSISVEGNSLEETNSSSSGEENPQEGMNSYISVEGILWRG
jgi:hypothetical protein